MKRMATVLAALGTAVIFQAATQAISAAVVRITPLGGADGEFCILDRTMVFEDPDGTHLGVIRGPEVPRNIAFGGPDFRTIYATPGVSLYSFRVKTPGIRPY